MLTPWNRLLTLAFSVKVLRQMERDHPVACNQPASHFASAQCKKDAKNLRLISKVWHWQLTRASKMMLKIDDDVENCIRLKSLTHCESLNRKKLILKRNACDKISIQTITCKFYHDTLWHASTLCHISEKPIIWLLPTNCADQTNHPVSHESHPRQANPDILHETLCEKVNVRFWSLASLDHQ